MENKPIQNESETCGKRCIHHEWVERARNNALPPDRHYRLARLFAVLGDPTRLTIVQALSQHEMCVCDLATLADVSESAASHQLRRLRDMDLVRPRRDGQILYYRLADDHVVQLLKMGVEHVME